MRYYRKMTLFVHHSKSVDGYCTGKGAVLIGAHRLPLA